MTLPSWLEAIFLKASLPLPATASVSPQSHTLAENFASASLPSHKSSPNSDSYSSKTPSTQSHDRDRLISIAPPHPAVQTQSWILFGVKGSRRTLTPTQVSINDQSTDYSVFQELKRCYQTRRGRLRLWFSIWRLENCEVVKVQYSIPLP